MVAKSKIQRLLGLISKAGIMRPRELKALGIPMDYLWHLHQRGMVERVGRGLYCLQNIEATEHHSLAEACKRVPQRVICLFSALRFHGITTQSPFETWMAIDRKAWLPKPGDLPLRIVRLSGKALTEGVKEHRIEGVPVKVYNPAKTVADCFKYRNKIGRDVALEALRDCLRQRKCTREDLWRYAKICRVANVMTPYLEAIT